MSSVLKPCLLEPCFLSLPKGNQIMKNSLRFTSVLLAFILLFSSAAIPSFAQNKEAVLIKAGQLIDVRGGRVLTNQAILIEGDRIKEVGDMATVTGHAPANARVIDLSNATVLPGLIDCHVHLTADLATIATAFTISVPREALTGAKNARLTLDAGFTTVRNLAASGYSDIALRDAINAGDVPGPRVCASGPALGPTGG